MSKRHTCIICGSKRYEHHMKKVFGNSWACKNNYHYSHFNYFSLCCDNREIQEAIKVIEMVSKWKHISLKHLSTISEISPENVTPELTMPRDKK
jgi:hypothetical protein